jgi:hypothetical protein
VDPLNKNKNYNKSIMSQQTEKIPFRRQSKIHVKLSIADSDNGLRITVKSERLTTLANLLMSKYVELADSGNRISNEFHKVRDSLNFRNETFGDHKVNTLVNTQQIPNLRFLVTNDLIAETTINDVFTNAEKKEFIDLFVIFVKLMKKINKEFDLLD